MSEHTPGRIQLAKEFDGHIMTMDGLAVSDCCLDYSSLDHDQQASNARRLVACWNACEGIDTEYLEGDESLPHYARRLMTQRDELLAALEGLTGDIQALIGESDGVAGLHMNGDVAPWGELEAGGRFERLTHLPTAHAAIAKVKGGAA